MTGLRVILARLIGMIKSRSTEADLNEDIQAHLDFLTEEYIERGMNPGDARAAARRDFGGIDQMKETYRDQRGFPRFDAFGRDLRYTLRGLRRTPAFTFVAIASLAVGIGLNAAVFPVVDSLLLGMRLPVQQPARLIDIYTSAADGSRYSGTSYPDYLDFKERSTAFKDIAAYSPFLAAVRNGQQSRTAVGEVVTGNYFQLLGVGAGVGRTLLPEDDRPGAPRVAVISHKVWLREFNRNPAVVGRTIFIHGQPYVIVGVVPQDFTGVTSILAAEIWTAMVYSAEVERFGISESVPSPGNTALERRGHRWLFLKGRLKNDETVSRAEANLEAVIEQLGTEYPATNKDRRVNIMRTEDVRIHPAANTVLVGVSGAVWVLASLALLVTCANVAGMLLARASARQSEIAVRIAIGGSRARVIQQLLTESVVLSVLGAAGGIVFADLLLRTVSSVRLPTLVPISLEVSLGVRALWYTAGLSLIAGIIAGLAPALRSSRPDVAARIKGEFAVRQRRWWRWPVRDALVTLQIAIALVLLVVGALLTRSALAMRQVDPGFQAAGVAAISVPLGLIGYDVPRAKQFYDRAFERIGAMPGVDAVALTLRPPLDLNINTELITIPGQPDNNGKGLLTWTTFASPEYFDTLKIAIVEGRNFRASDTAESPHVAIINRTMAKRYWPKESAIGKHFRVPAKEIDFEVVGVAADHKVVRIGEPPTPYIHFPVSQWSGTSWVLLARGRGDAATLVSAVTHQLIALEPNIVLPSNRTMQGLLDMVLLPAQLAAFIVAAVAALAMLLAAVGLYGVIAYSVERRTREIGIRMALGARRGEVVAMVMRQGLKLAALGVLGGAILAVGAAHFISAALSGIVGSGDPVAWSVALLTLLITTLLANAIPARRAARIEPAIALRNE